MDRVRIQVASAVISWGETPAYVARIEDERRRQRFTVIEGGRRGASMKERELDSRPTSSSTRVRWRR